MDENDDAPDHLGPEREGAPIIESGKGSSQDAHIFYNLLAPVLQGATQMPTSSPLTTELHLLKGSPSSSASHFRHITQLSHGQRLTGNAIIQGDNLRILKILEPYLANKVRCVYIDPPYNNQECYTHYKDELSHEEWLEDMTCRLSALHPLLAKNGSIWISIDDRECHYLKVAADKVFGRQNFVSTVIWQQRTTRENRKVFSNNHEYLLVYAKDAREFKGFRNRFPLPPNIATRYKNPDRDPRGPWQSVSANVQAGHATASQFYAIVAPNGKRHVPPNGRCWIYNEGRMKSEIAKNNIWFGAANSGVPRLKKFLDSPRTGLNPETLWFGSEVGTSDSAKKHLLAMFPRAPVFDTPKPESLIARILHIATNPGDLVIDAFLGSGSTAAVAHKMRRHYLGIEREARAAKLAAERLKRVVKSELGGISIPIGWKGGGGFDFYRLLDS